MFIWQMHFTDPYKQEAQQSPAFGLTSADLLQIFRDGALNELKDFSAMCGRVLVPNMCVEVGAGIRLVFASRTR